MNLKPNRSIYCIFILYNTILYTYINPFSTYASLFTLSIDTYASSLVWTSRWPSTSTTTKCWRCVYLPAVLVVLFELLVDLL